MAEISYGYSQITKGGRKRNIPVRMSLEATIKPNDFGNKENNFKFDEKVFAKYSRTNRSIKNKMGLLMHAVDKMTTNYDTNRVIPKPNQFKNDLDVFLERKKVVRKMEATILEYCHEKIENDKKDLERGVEGAIKEGTIKTYVTISHHIENYQIAAKEVLNFKTFDVKKYWDYWDTLDDILSGKIVVINSNQRRKQRIQEYGFLKTSLRKYQVSFLNLLKRAEQDGCEIGMNPHEKKLLVSKEESSKDFYVVESDIKKIIDADVTFDKGMQSAKELFLTASLTGSRFESIVDLHKTKIERCKSETHSFQYIHSKHNKNATEVFIPLLSPILDILRRHDDKFPKFYNNSKTNIELKRLFHYLGISSNQDQILRTYRNGDIVSLKKMSDLISTHDGKKSFTSNLAIYQVPEAITSSVIHPDRPSKNKMYKVYNKMTMLDSAKLFVDEINKIDSKVYTF